MVRRLERASQSFSDQACQTSQTTGAGDGILPGNSEGACTEGTKDSSEGATVVAGIGKHQGGLVVADRPGTAAIHCRQIEVRVGKCFFEDSFNGEGLLGPRP